MKRKTRYLLKLFTSKRPEAVWALFILFLLSPILLIVYLYKLFKKNKNNEKSYELAIKTMSPYEFEYYVANVFKKLGYKIKVTPSSNDFGIDIIARSNCETIAIQVKKYNDHPVGNRDVQMLLGAMQKKGIKANKSILVTTSYFTQKARIQAEDCPIELWDGKKLRQVINKIQKS